MSLSRDELSKLLHLLDVTEPDEIDCSVLLHRIAGFVECLDLDPAPSGYEDVVQHLAVCPECREEFEALRRVLRDDREHP